MRAFDRYALSRAAGRVVGLRGDDSDGTADRQVELDSRFAAALHVLHLAELLHARRRGERPAAEHHRARAAELAWALHQLNAWRRAAGGRPQATPG
jgi:hypothetical protein